MKKTEKISLMISIVLISLIAIGAVSAADADAAIDDSLSIADDVQTIDSYNEIDEIIQSPEVIEETQAVEDEPTLTEDDSGDETKTFTQLITDIGDESSEVTLTGTYKFDSEVDTAYPVITRDLTINGPATIDGNGLTRLLYVQNHATLTLKNLNLINGASNQCAGIVATNASLDIQGCTFKNNVASGHIGAIQMSRIGSIIVKDSVFEGNKAGGQGAAIYAPATITPFEVINCTFIDNEADYGTIATSSPNSKIINCSFISNYASTNGGGVYIAGGDAIIKDSVFKYNTANGGSAISVFSASSTISNCVFDSNVVPSTNETGNNGAVSLMNFYADDTLNSVISKCIFVNNSAFRGSAIESYQNNFVVEESIFLDNIATDEVYKINASSGGPQATDIYLQHNQLEITATVNNIWFGNTADNYTASLQTYNKTSEMWQGFANVHIDNWYYLDLTETAGSTYYDVLVSLNNLYTNSTGEITQVTDCALPDWNVTLSATAGTVTPTEVTLENGVAHAQYALTADQGPATITADASGPTVSKELEGLEPSKTFIQLIADIGTEASEVTLEGGYKYDPDIDQGSYPVITRDLTITGPATIDGSGLTRLLAVTSGTLTLKNITLINGYVSGYGAGIFAQGGNLDIQDCTFKNNVAGSIGGALVINTNSYLKVTDTIFESNKASTAGVIYVGAGATGFEVNNCAFIDCNASGDGGAIYDALANGKIYNSNFTSNNAVSSGGAIWLYGENTIVSGCNFISNKANTGGAIYTTGANTIVEDSVFKENTGTGMGSAIYVWNVKIDISNCIFDSNVAPSTNETGGKGTVLLYNLYNDDLNSVISKCIFVNNTALRGSAITSMMCSFVVEDSIFLDNIATDEVYKINASSGGPQATDIYVNFNEREIIATVNNIWFGNTADNYTASLQTYNKTSEMWQGFANTKVGSWYFLNITETPVTDYYDILISLNNLYNNDTGEVTQVTDCALPDWNVSLSATAGTVTPTEVTLENGVAHVNYALTADQGPATITANAAGPTVSKELPGIAGKEDVTVTTSSETVTVTYPASGSITITASAPGSYSVHVGDNVYTAVIDTAGGSATVSVPTLPVGNYDVSVTAPETEQYNAVNTGKIATYTVNPGTVTITSADVTVTYPSTDSVTITASAAGEYTVKVGDKTYSAVITQDGGSANVAVELLDVGDYGISVTGNAGDNYNPVDTGIINYYHVIAGSITVSGQGTTVTYPDKGTIVITTDVAGAYTINVGDKTYENVQLDAGDNSFAVADLLDANTHAVTVSANIPNYNPIANQNIATYTVNKGTITVSSEDVTVTYPNVDSVTITASVAGYYYVGIGGNIFEVRISEDGGSNTVSVTRLDVGAYQVTVSADIANYEPIVDKAVSTYTVNKGTVVVSVTNNTVGYPDSGSFTVTASVGGEYTVKYGTYTEEIVIGEGGGSYTVTVPVLVAGVYDISVTGTVDNYEPVNTGNIGTYTVTKGFLREFELQANATTITYGDTISLTSNVEVYDGATASGTVTYYIDDVETGAIVSVDKLAAGTHTVVAKYTGDPNIEDTTSNAVTITVNKATPVVSLTADNYEISYGQSVTLSGVVTPDDATGLITYYVDGVAVDSNVLSDLTVGTYTVTAKYAGNDNYNEAESEPITITVNKATPVVDVVADKTEITYGESVTLNYVLSPSGITGDVTYYLDGEAVTGNVLEGLTAGYHNVYASYSGNDNFSPAVSELVFINVLKATPVVTLSADKTDITFGESVTLSGVVTPDDATGLITYYVDGVAVDSNVLSDLTVGTYTVTAKYAGNDNYNEVDSNSITINVAKATPVVTLSADKYEIDFGESVTLTGAVSPSAATGDVTYYVNDVLVDSNVLSDLAAGTYTVVAKYAGDSNFNVADSDPVTITVNKVASSVSVNPISSTYGVSATAEATLTGATGLTAAIADYPDAVTVNGNEITVLYGLPAGTYTMVVTTVPDDNHTEVSINVDVTIGKADSTVALSADKTEIDFGDSITLNYVLSPSGAAGDVTYYLDGEAVTGNVLSGLAAGTYTVVAKYAGDNNFKPSESDPVTITVKKIDSTVAVDPISFTYGGSASASATLTGADTVTAVINGFEGAATVNGKDITVSGLPAGTYTMVVTTVPDDNHNAVSINVEVTVAKADSAVSVDPISFAYGATGTGTATLVGAETVTATIADYPNAVTVSGNVITVSGLPVGSFTMVVTTVPDANHNAVSIEVPVGVGKEDAAIVLSADKTEIDFGDSITLTAVVSPSDATGPITYYVDLAAVDSNVLSGLAAGTYNVHAMYAGDDNYNAAVSNTISITVNPVASSVAVDPISFTYGGSASATATLTGATGFTATIADYPNAVTVSGNEISVAGLPAGTYTMVVTTVPDDNHTAATINVDVTVAKADASVALSADKTEITFGESVTLTGTVSPSDATGDVTYYVNDVLADSNVLSGLAAGTYTVTAKYAGNENYNEAVSDPISITVDQAVPIVSVTADPVKYGMNGDVVVQVTGVDDAPLEGITVKVIVNEKEYTGVTDASGVAHVAIDILPVAEYPIAVDTVASGNYAAGRNNDKSLVVNKGDLTITAVPSASSVDYGSEISFTNTINAPEGTTTAGNVKYCVDGVEIDGNSISTLVAGPHTVVAKYSGDSNFNDAESESVEFTVNKVASTVSVDPISFTYGGSASAAATLTGADTVTAVINGFDGAVTVNGKDITVAGLPAGTYDMVVTTVPDANHEAATITVVVTVAKADATLTLTADKNEIDFGDSITLTGVVSPSDATGAVTYYLDGVAVEGNVLSDLAAGTYTVTAKYAGDDNYNAVDSNSVSITVKPVASSVSVDPINFAYGATGTGVATLTGATGLTATIADYPNAVTVDGNVITVSGLPVGSFTMVVTTVPDANHTAVSIEVPVGVGKEDATVALSADKTEIDFGDSITLTAVVSPSDATGPITYYVDLAAADSNVLSGLAAGTYNVHAMYAGDDNYNAAVSNTISITVNPVASTVSADPISFTYGATGTGTATLTGATGLTATIEGYPEAVTVSGNEITVVGLPAGNYIMVVTTVPDANHTAVSIEVAVAVNKATPAVSIAPSKDAFAYGEDAVLDVTVMNGETGVTGTVIVTIGDVKYAVDVTDGTGQLTVKGLSNGTYEATAKFIANDNFNEASALEPANVVVSASTDAVITASVSEPSAEGEATLTVNVVDGAGNPVTGKVNVTVGDGEAKEYDVTGGVASIPLTGLALGENTIVVSTNEYTADPVSLTAVVPPKATAEVSVSIEDGSITIEAKDGTAPLNGTATVVIDGGEPITVPVDETGKADIPMDNLAPGQHTVEVTFANENYEPVTEVATVNVPKATNATVTLTVDPASIKENETATIKVSLADGDTKLNGIVIVTIDGTDYAVNVAAGEGSVTIDNLAPNTYTITGKFLGDDVYAEASAADQTLEVTKVAKVALNVTTQGSNIVITLADEDGNPVSGKVNVTIDGSTKEMDVTNGVATVPVGEGNHNVTVSYPGEAVDGGSQVVNNIVYVKKSADQKIKTKITVTKNQTITYNKTIDNKTKYYIYGTLTDINGNILANKTIRYFAHKKVYVTKTNSKGQFKFSVAHVGYGECTHGFTFVGDDDYEACFAVACISIKKQKVKLTSKARTFKATKKVKKLTATLKNSKGKALKGKKITFVVNGKKYTAKTNKKGVATVKINVTKKKTYKVKVTFAGDKTYAKKTVNRSLKIT